MSKLPVLVRLHKRGLDEARGHLAVCEEARAALAARLIEHDASVVTERNVAGRTIDGVRAYPAFSARMARQRVQLERQVAEATVAVDQAGELVAERFRELKTLDLAVAAEAEAKRVTAARLEQARLDEIGGDRARRAALERRG